MSVISFTKVSLPYGWLGNMAPYPIVVKDLSWRTNEALFQAYRFAAEDPVREEIRSQTSPMAAKMVAKRCKERMVVVPQSEQDLQLMELVLRLKLKAHPGLKTKLLATGDATIIEDCTSRPRGSGLFWGAALQPDETWKGNNQLGKLWMQLRQELAASSV